MWGIAPKYEVSLGGDARAVQKSKNFILSRKVKTLFKKWNLYFYHTFWDGLTSDTGKPYLQDELQMPLL